MLEVNRSSVGLDKAATAGVFGLGMLLCMAVTWSMSKQLNQTTVAALATGLLVVVALVAPLTSIVMTFAYLALLGDIRRLFVWQTGAMIDADPMLLVGPIAAIGIVLTPFAKGKLDFDNRFSRLILCFSIIMLLEVFNPYQGGLMVGLAGGLFYLIPMVWFYVGQAYGTEENLRMMLFRVVVPIAVVACLFALWQTFLDFPEYQQVWIDLIRKKFTAINVGDRVRPFAFFVSPAEFAHYSMALTVIAVSPLYRLKLRPVVFMTALGIAGYVLQGGRGPIVMTTLALVLMFAALGRTAVAVITRLAIAGVVAIGVIAIALLLVAGSGDLNEKIAPIIERQQSGLMNPLDQRQSTLLDHLQMGIFGVTTGVRYPLGVGLGASTIAGAKMSGDEDAGGSTEIDFANMFVSLGLAGGIVYLIIIGHIFVMAWRYVAIKRTALSLAILGLLVCQFTQWLNGSQYAIATLIWFTIGSLSRQTEEMKQEMLAATV